MTDATRLALARKVYPNEEWYLQAGCICAAGVITTDQFDPEHNDSQAWAVLAWLTKNGLHSIGSANVNIKVTVAVRVNQDGLHEMRPAKQSIPHDGTAAGLRQAVTDAGMRVVGEVV